MSGIGKGGEPAMSRPDALSRPWWPLAGEAGTRWAEARPTKPLSR